MLEMMSFEGREKVIESIRNGQPRGLPGGSPDALAGMASGAEDPLVRAARLKLQVQDDVLTSCAALAPV